MFPRLLLEYLSHITQWLNPSTAPLSTTLCLTNLGAESRFQPAFTLLHLCDWRLTLSILMGCDFLRFFRINLNLTRFNLTPFARRCPTALRNPTLGWNCCVSRKILMISLSSSVYLRTLDDWWKIIQQATSDRPTFNDLEIAVFFIPSDNKYCNVSLLIINLYIPPVMVFYIHFLQVLFLQFDVSNCCFTIFFKDINLPWFISSWVLSIRWYASIINPNFNETSSGLARNRCSMSFIVSSKLEIALQND